MIARQNESLRSRSKKPGSSKQPFQLVTNFIVFFTCSVCALATWCNLHLLNKHEHAAINAAVNVESFMDKEAPSERAVPVIETTAAALSLSSDVGESSERHHLIFSSSCGFKQDWQAYLLFHQAMEVKQPGTVTRIASGCDEQQKQELQKLHNRTISVMSDNFLLHFTPGFDRKSHGGNDIHWQASKYWNKPFGVRHWVRDAFGYSETNEHTEFDNDIVILIDPDMVLQKPLVNDFSGLPDSFWSRAVSNDGKVRKVAPGSPVAQDYSFGQKYINAAKKNLTHVVGADSPVHALLTNMDSRKYFSGGPPYMLTGHDMHAVSTLWCDFLPRLWDLFPEFMAEMFAYCLAAAHLGLRHNIARGLMISSVGLSGEGWYFLKDTTPATVCVDGPSHTIPTRPHVIHYCQRYAVGDFFMSKYITHHEFLECDEPLFRLPPADAAVQFNYGQFGNGDIKKWNNAQLVGNAFMVCTLYSAMNRAAIYYKKTHCGPDANFEETWNFFEVKAKAKQ